jgi:hypothetical protein
MVRIGDFCASWLLFDILLSMLFLLSRPTISIEKTSRQRDQHERFVFHRHHWTGQLLPYLQQPAFAVVTTTAPAADHDLPF